MAEHVSVQPEHARRKLVFYSAFAAALIAAACAVPQWLSASFHRGYDASNSVAALQSTSSHPGFDLLMQAVPPAIAAILLAGLCIGFSTLCPQPRLTLVNAITFPLMHVALTVALARLLSSSPSALIEPLPQQIPLQAWLSTTTWLTALGAELALFVIAATMAGLAGSRTQSNQC